MKSFVLYLFLTISVSIQAFATSAECEVYFSSNDRIADKLIERIQQEKKEILVAIYSFTHSGIGKALIEARERGVHVEVIIDREALKKQSFVHHLIKAGVPLYVWDPYLHASSQKLPIMHDKFCVLGDQLVWTGSFNFTFDGANRNEENVVVLSSEEITRLFRSHFLQLKQRHCRPYAQYLTLYAKKKK